ncbi:MAG TPA: hypothetical protein VKQ28_04575 [Candidatus Acidoferrum sp.]|nr:hypothetical protein [Candidatus Acidoferrum sp.]
MTGLLVITALAVSILIFGLRLTLQTSAARRRSPTVTIEEFSSARQALDSVFIEAVAIDRIFSAEDMEFIYEAGPPRVQRVFLRDRKALAIQWLRRTQKQVAQLMDLHLRLAAYTHEPSPRFELKLTAHYVRFILTSYILLLLLWLHGPFKARSIVSYISRVAGHFCTVFSLRLKSVNAADFDSHRPNLPAQS